MLDVLDSITSYELRQGFEIYIVPVGLLMRDTYIKRTILGTDTNKTICTIAKYHVYYQQDCPRTAPWCRSFSSIVLNNQ